MSIKKKPVAIVIAAIYCLWTAVLQPIWNLNIERIAEAGRLDKALLGWRALPEQFASLVAYLPHSFGLGFVVGALIFAYWDQIATVARRYIVRRHPQEILAESPSIRAWVGNMLANFDPETPNVFQLAITLLNIGDVPFSVSRVTGQITWSHDDGNGRRVETLIPYATATEKDWAEVVEPSYIKVLYLELPIPSNILRLLPDMFFWKKRPHLKFDGLDIFLSAEGSEEKRLKLWSSMRMTTGDWQVRCVETFPIFDSKEEHARFTKAMAGLGEALTRIGSNR